MSAFTSMAGYLGGALAGYCLGGLAMLALLPDVSLLDEGGAWIALNMGSSIWLFGLILTCYAANLMRLSQLLQDETALRQVAQLDQLSDVWIHLFIGTGVVWTAIGMRSALASTLEVPGALADDAGAVLARLVDGGILLALTTTIVGAVGGYVMKLAKTIWLGAGLAAYYHHNERSELKEALGQLTRIETHLAAALDAGRSEGHETAS